MTRGRSIFPFQINHFNFFSSKSGILGPTETLDINSNMFIHNDVAAVRRR